MVQQMETNLVDPLCGEDVSDPRSREGGPVFGLRTLEATALSSLYLPWA